MNAQQKCQEVHMDTREILELFLSLLLQTGSGIWTHVVRVMQQVPFPEPSCQQWCCYTVSFMSHCSWPVLSLTERLHKASHLVCCISAQEKQWPGLDFSIPFGSKVYNEAFSKGPVELCYRGTLDCPASTSLPVHFFVFLPAFSGKCHCYPFLTIL